MILKSQDLYLLVDILPPNGVPTFYDLMLAAYKANTFPLKVLQMLGDGMRSSTKISLRDCKQ
jgi:hypothetical protein